MMSIYRCIATWLLLLASGGVYADAQPTVEAFKKEYAKYQQYSGEKQWKNALPYAEQSYQMGAILFGGSSKNTAALSYNYGRNLLKVRKNKKAEKILKKTLKLYEVLYAQEPEQLIPLLMDLGHSLARPYEKTAQKKYYNKALRLAVNYYGEGSVAWAEYSLEAGVNLYSKALSFEAKKYLYQAYGALYKKFGEKELRTGLAAFHIGKFEMSAKDYNDAIVYLNKALASFVLPEQASNKFELSTHGFLVEAYERLGDSSSATQHCLAIGRMTPATSLQDYKPLVKVAPIYPMSAANLGKEGFVTVEYEVDDFGFVRNPKVIDSAGPKSFLASSLKAAKKFRYAPSFKEGKAVTTKGVRNKFTFILDKE